MSVNQFQDLACPQVNIGTEGSKRSFLKESARSAFVEYKGTTSKRIIKAWYGQGLGGVLEELSKDNMGRATGSRSTLHTMTDLLTKSSVWI